ncbi:MAG: hypothetical protein R3Y12_06470 [Clostridia bacterium]
MLLKLIKYDFKYLFKMLIPLYVVCLGLALINGFLLIPSQYNSSLLADEDLVAEFFYMMLDLFVNLSACMIFSINLFAIIWGVKRFFTNVFGKEGYLTNTLPVTHHEVILSKLISITIAIIASFVAFCFIISLFYMGIYDITVADIVEVKDYLVDVPLSFTISLYLCGVVVLMSTVLQIFASISIGHLTKNRILCSYIAYFVLANVIVQPITTLFTLDYVKSVEETIIYMRKLNLGVFTPLLWGYIVSFAVLGLIFYFITQKIIKNKLNLQ